MGAMENRRIYLVCLLPRKAHWTALPDPSQPDEFIAIFRHRKGEYDRGYLPYEYRAGLRHRRLMRIIGRRVE
jgi:hypothetical protein